MTGTDQSGAGASVPAPSMGDVLRVSAYVTDLIGNDQVRGVNIYSIQRVHLDMPDLIHAEIAAGLLGMSGPHDIPATRHEDTGVGAHSYWCGEIRGVEISINSELRPGALPAPRPWDWSPTADVMAAA